MISFIVAMDKNCLIGSNNNLPWVLPDDLKRFKKITMGHPIIMGRKTYESIGKPLPGRKNIILTRNKGLSFEGCTVFHSTNDLMDYCLCQSEEFFVIGGAEIFKIFLPYVDKLYITKINDEFSGDVYFPELDWSKFQPITREKGMKDKKNPYDYEYVLYEKMTNN